jgi:hypothetical protein
MLNSGKLINNQLLNVTNTLANNGGQFNNNNTTNCTNINNSATGVLTNATDAKITISNSFTNSARANLSKKSLVICNNFYNSTETSTISGSADILNGSNVPDVEFYPQIFVYQQSSNHGRLEGYLNLMDPTIANPNNPIKIDDVGITSVISSNVLFENGCSNNALIFTLSPNKTFFCPNENLSISYTSPFTILSSNWSFSGSYQNATPPSNNVMELGSLQVGGLITFNAYIIIGNRICSYTKVWSITVGNATISTTSPLYFGVGNNVNLTSTVTAGNCPCQYTWLPNEFFNASGNTLANPTATPMVSFIYTVTMTDNYGCSASNTIMVISQPFALLDKSLNGEHYKLFNNQLFFKYDGQYDNTNLIYRVYNKDRVLVASNPPTTASPNLLNYVTSKPGDNRYTLNTSTLSNGYFVLEVLNEKRERLYLRFKK